MRYLRLGIFIFVFLFLTNARIFANGVDSVFIKYRASQKFSFRDFSWDSSTMYYLAQKKANIFYNSISGIALRKIDLNWMIIRFDNRKRIEDLKQFFTTVVPASSFWKCADNIQLLFGNSSANIKGVYRVGYVANSWPSFLNQSAILKKHPDYNCVDILVERSLELLQIASDNNVVSITRVAEDVRTEQALDRMDFSVNGITAAHSKFPTITGRGTVASLKENLFDTVDIDFKNRFFSSQYSAKNIENHATIMATMIGGSGNSFYMGKGAAWQCTITSADFKNLMPEPLAYYNEYKIDAQNHSYGTGIEYQYAPDAAAYDLTTWQDTGLLHVFSSGNSGTSISGNGVYKGISGFANITGSFKMSKNSIVVGGIDSFFRVQALSSKGPAYDGRIKPELVAYGEDGTSGAAALVTGGVLLLKQQLKRHSVNSSAALIKALLINGANNLESESPSFVSGYGNMNIFQSLQIVEDKKYFTDVLSSNENSELFIELPIGAKDLKVTLAWSDTPANALSSNALMNDLDLKLQHEQTNEIWYPWIKSTAADKDSLQLPARRGADHINNVELVTLKTPQPGRYKIKVAPYDLVSNKQPFAIAYSWQTGDVAAFVFPTKNDVITANEQEQIVRWQSSFNTNVKGNLELKIVGNSNWKLLTDTLPVSQRWYQWKVPDTVAKAQLRMSVDGKFFVSDTFIISRPIDLQVGFDCKDSVLVYWQKIKEAQQYRIYNLGDTLMEPITIVSDTFFTIKKSDLDNSYISVAPIIHDSEVSKSYTIDYSIQGVGCYIKNFLVDLDGNTAFLQIALGSEYNLKNIEIEKEVNGVFVNRHTIIPSLFALYTFSDDELQQGKNSYRIRLELSDGKIVYSQIETVYFTANKLYVLFPNPVSRNQKLSIINNYPDGNLEALFYDAVGRLVKSSRLSFSLNELDLKTIPTGVYIILFKDGSKKMGIQKLVVY
jgi:hypothetical protein